MMMSHNNNLQKATKNEHVTSSTDIEEPLLSPSEEDLDGIEERLETDCMRSFDVSTEPAIQLGLPPLIFVVVNSVLFASIMNGPGYDSIGKDRVPVFHHKSQIAALFLLADAVFFYKTIGWLKIEQNKLEEEEELKEEEDSASSKEGGCACAGHEDETQEPIAKPSDTTTQRRPSSRIPTYPFARLSRKLDAFLLGGGSNSPATVPKKVSTLMGLLHALMVLCAAGSMASVGVRVTAAELFDCLARNSPPPRHDFYDREWSKDAETKKIEGIPDGLQNWAAKYTQGKPYLPNTVPGTYVRMKDGRTFFRGRTWMEYNAAKNNRSPTILFGTSPNGSLKKFENIRNAGSFVAVLGSPEEDTVETFCCLYNEAPLPDDTLAPPPDLDARRVLCLSSNDDEFRNASVPEQEKPNQALDYGSDTLESFEGTLWYASCSRWRDERCPGGDRRCPDDDVRVTFYQLDSTRSMQWKLMSNATYPLVQRPTRFRRERGNTCASWVTAICSLLAGVVVIPAAFWLLRVKQVAAGVSPASILGYYTARAFGKEYFYMLTFWLPLLSTILIIRYPPKWMDREALIWAHYSLCPYLAILAFDHDERATINLFWVIFLGAIMNHRILEIAGYCAGCLFIFMAFYDNDGDALSMLSLPMGIITACGMITIDRQIQKYHSYVVFRLKRFVRELK